MTMTATRRLVNRSAVREAFHAQDERLPRGFFDELEQEVYTALRRIADGEVTPAEDAVLGEAVYVKRASLKEALRGALGKTRVENSWVAHLNAIVAAKVGQAVTKKVAASGVFQTTAAVPGAVVRFLLTTQEHRSGVLPFQKFARRWLNPEFRAAWTERAKPWIEKNYRGKLKASVMEALRGPVNA